MGLGDALRDEDALQPNGQAYDNLRAACDQRDVRIGELERACTIALHAYRRVSNVGLPGDVAGDLVHARETLRAALRQEV